MFILYNCINNSFDNSKSNNSNNLEKIYITLNCIKNNDNKC